VARRDSNRGPSAGEAGCLTAFGCPLRRNIASLPSCPAFAQMNLCRAIRTIEIKSSGGGPANRRADSKERKRTMADGEFPTSRHNLHAGVWNRWPGRPRPHPWGGSGRTAPSSSWRRHRSSGKHRVPGSVRKCCRKPRRKHSLRPLDLNSWGLLLSTGALRVTTQSP